MAALVHMDMTVMDLLMTDNNMTIPNIEIVTLPHITPIPMERHNMVIHITQTTHEAATDTKCLSVYNLTFIK